MDDDIDIRFDNQHAWYNVHGAVHSRPSNLLQLQQVLDETVKPVTKEVQAGRNDPCPCGSGQKYKRCCRGQHA